MINKIQKQLFKTGSKKGLIVLVDVEDFNDFFVWLKFESYYSEPQIIKFYKVTKSSCYFNTEMEAKQFLIDGLISDFESRKLIGKQKTEPQYELLDAILKIENFETI